MPPRLRLTRPQILAFRRRVGGLEQRVPRSAASLRRAAWAGLQDSMPRAAVLSLHARIEEVDPMAWADRSLAQLWGPRYSTYVVPKRDFALFSLSRLPEDEKGRQRAERIAGQVRAHLAGRRMTDRQIHRELGIGNSIRYAAPTGTLAIRWEGARAPLVWEVRAPSISPDDACRELARRHLHVFGPTTAIAFARWAGISRRAAARAYASLDGTLIAVSTPLGDECLLAEDEEDARTAQPESTSVRLLPSGDAYTLLDGAERDLLVPRAEYRNRLWTPRVWPGAILVDGEIRGTWRRVQHTVRIEAWGRLPAAKRAAVEAEAATLPLPGLERPIDVVWGAE